jgi:AcrR family transcriptional regulator
VRQTEKAIFGATVALVHDAGPGQVTVEAVAARSGVARSTIYRRWPDVDQLFLEAFDEVTRLAPLPLTGELDTDLRSFATSYAYELNDATFHDVLVFLMDAALRSRQHRSHYRAIGRRRQRRAVAIVETAIASGELPDGVDGRVVADTLMALLFHRRIAKHELLTDTHVNGAVDAVLASILPGRDQPTAARATA